jgi:hypothetical protein
MVVFAGVPSMNSKRASQKVLQGIPEGTGEQM